MTWVGFMLCVTGGLPMVIPRAYVLFDVLQTLSDAQIIYNFGSLLMNLLAGDNIHDPNDIEHRASLVLAQLPPAEYLKVPPCCCFFLCGPHTHPRQFTATLVQFLRGCLRQFVVIGPLTSIVALCLELEGSLSVKTRNTVLVVRVVGTVSIMVAMWAMAVLYKATRHKLSRFRTSIKFIAIKLMLLTTAVQEMVIATYLKQHKGEDENSNHRFTSSFKAQFYMSFVVCVEGSLLTLLLLFAFPGRELQQINAESRASLTGKDTQPPAAVRGDANNQHANLGPN